MHFDKSKNGVLYVMEYAVFQKKQAINHVFEE